MFLHHPCTRMQFLLEQRKKTQEEEDDFATEQRAQALDQTLAYCQRFRYVLICSIPRACPQRPLGSSAPFPHRVCSGALLTHELDLFIHYALLPLYPCVQCCLALENAESIQSEHPPVSGGFPGVKCSCFSCGVLCAPRGAQPRSRLTMGVPLLLAPAVPSRLKTRRRMSGKCSRTRRHSTYVPCVCFLPHSTST